MFTNWLHDLALFFVNVLSHWQALATGGFVTALVGFIEKRRNKSLSWESYATIMAVFVVYSFFAAWQDEHRNTETVKAEKSAEVAEKNSCLQNRLIADAYTRGLEGLNREQRERIDHQQTTNDAQQHDVSSCVVSLGKMNPKVREEIVVVSIPIAMMDSKGKLANHFTLIKKYVSLLLVTTNEVEPRFHGRLRCTNVFLPLSSPQLPGTSQTTMVVSAAPHRIDDYEYEISSTVSGTEWSPAHPAYMTVSTDDESPGTCTFTPIG